MLTSKISKTFSKLLISIAKNKISDENYTLHKGIRQIGQNLHRGFWHDNTFKFDSRRDTI